MNIVKRKCDGCGAKHESDDPKYHEYGRFMNRNGDELDLCPDCIARLLQSGGPVRPA